eukprot:3591947-Amphidinium_carterae.1
MHCKKSACLTTRRCCPSCDGASGYTIPLTGTSSNKTFLLVRLALASPEDWPHASGRRFSGRLDP